VPKHIFFGGGNAFIVLDTGGKKEKRNPQKNPQTLQTKKTPDQITP